MKKLILSLLIFSCISYLTSCNDACSGVVCKNDGTAVVNGSNCNCECKAGFEGPYCEVRTRERITGDYNVTADCSPATIDTTFTIIPSGTFEDRVHIYLNYRNPNCGAVTYPDPPYMTVNKNKLTMPAQPYTIYGKEYTISGSGTYTSDINGTVINLSINPSPADSCFKPCNLVLTKI